MLERLFPKDNRFFGFFERHVALMVMAAREFQSLAQTGENIASRARRIKELEHETDVITHQCVEALHRTRRPPLPRDDVYRLITKMDDVVDFIEAASERITLYDLREMTPACRELADILVKATEEIVSALEGLRVVKGSRQVLEHCIEINRLENEGDTILRTAVANLFRNERDPIQIIKWKEIYEFLETATDRCEDVANIIEGVTLENA